MRAVHPWPYGRLFTKTVAALVLLAGFAATGADGKDIPSAGTSAAGLVVPAEITLPQAVALALMHNPDLAAYALDVRAAEARQIQAGLRPNPVLSVELENLRLGDAPGQTTTSRSQGAGFGDAGLAPVMEWSRESERSDGGVLGEAEFTLSLSQVVELGGKRAKRAALAANDKAVWAWDYEIARANVLASTATHFVGVLAAQERVRLNEELVNLAGQVLHTVSARVQAGRVSPLEEKKAKTALETAELTAACSRRDLVAARVRLAAMWGGVEALFDHVAGALDAVKEIPDLEALTQRVQKNPDLFRWRAEMDKRAAALALERAKATPDITVSAGLRTRNAPGAKAGGWTVGTEGIRHGSSSLDADDGVDTLFVAGVSIPLPLFDRNQGNIREAEHLAAKAAQERRAAAIRAQSSLAQAYQELSNAAATIQALTASVLPSVTETYAAVNEAYKQGKFGFLDVLDAQRTLFETRAQYLDALAAYHTTVAGVERLIGESLWPETEAVAPSGKE